MKPVNKKLAIEIEKPTAGSLDLSSKQTATEYGTITAIGDEVTKFKVGQKIMFKAWAIDVISYEGVNYNFITEDSEAICAII